MNKKISILISILAFQLLFFAGLFTDLLLTKHNVVLTYNEIQEVCYGDKNIRCELPIDFSGLESEQIEKIRDYKIEISITYHLVLIAVLKAILLGFNICLFLYFFYRHGKEKHEDADYSFWMYMLFALGASYKFIHLYLNNIRTIPFGLFAFIFIFSCVVFFAVYFIFYISCKNKSRSILSSLFIVGILINSVNVFEIKEMFTSRYFIIDNFIVMGAVFLVCSMSLLINSRKVLVFVKYFIISLLLLSISNCIFNLIKQTGFWSLNKNTKQIIRGISKNHNIKKSEFNKNVYIIMFDMYAGDSTLKHLGCDNQKFWKFLEDEKFFLKKDFQSNYHYTLLTLPSFLNLDYVENLPYKNSQDSLKDIVLFDIFKSQGYQIFYHNPIPSFIQIGENSIDYLNTSNSFLRQNTLNFLLGETTYKNFLLDPLLNLSYFNENRDDKFFKIIFNENAKKLVFIHYLMPHYPYSYDENGTPLKEKFNSIKKGVETLNKEGYVPYLKYTNKQAELIVKKIKKQDSNAVILLIGDHGARIKLFSNGEDNHKEELENDKMIIHSAFNTFMAFYNPDDDNKHIKKAETLVNLSRMLVNELFQANIELLPDKRFFLYTNNSARSDFRNLRGMYLE